MSGTAAEGALEGAETVAICVPDNIGRLVGKRIPIRRWPDVARCGLSMPDFHLVTGIDNTPYGDLEVTGDHTGFHNGTLLPFAETLFRTRIEPETAFVLAEALGKDGRPFAESPRRILARQIDRLGAQGFGLRCAVEIEFYLFRSSYAEAHDRDYRDLAPLYHHHADNDILTAGFAEPFLAELRRVMAEAGLGDDTTQGEGGPGQYEITFEPGDPLRAADHAVIFKHLTKALAQREGFAASFMARLAESWASSGGHLHLQLLDNDGRPLLDETVGLHPAARAFLAGLLRFAPDFMLLHAPYRNSYQRMQPGSFAPGNCTWGIDNRTTLVRQVGGGASTRLEFRLPGADLNPYHSLAAVIAAGIEGLVQDLEPPPPVSGNAYAQNPPPLPGDLAEAITAFAASSVAARALTPPVQRHVLALAAHERDAGRRAVTDWDIRRGFERA